MLICDAWRIFNSMPPVFIEAGDMMTRFVVLATGRSGSTWVADMLNSHPAIIAVRAELLFKKRKRLYWRVAKEPCGGAQDIMFWPAYLETIPRYLRWVCKPYVLFRYLDTFYTPRTGIRAIGWKLLYEQARAHPDVLGYFVFKRVAILHLVRRNFLDVVISQEAVVARGRIHARVGDKVQQVAIRLDPSTVVQRLAFQEYRVRKARRILSRLGLRYIEVFYEDLVSGATPFARLVNFLGIESGQHTLTSSLQKLNQAPHHEIIENYAEVRHTLEGTRFRPLLQGP